MSEARLEYYRALADLTATACAADRDLIGELLAGMVPGPEDASAGGATPITE